MLSDTPAGNTAEVPVYEARTLYQVPIDLVREDPNQPRKSFDAQGLEEMVASVSKHGGDLESSSWLAAWGARNGDRCKCRDDFGKK